MIKKQRRFLLAGLTLASLSMALLVGLVLLWNQQKENPPNIGSDDVVLSGNHGLPKKIGLASHEETKTIESKPVQAKFSFNAVAPHWKESFADQENVTHAAVKIRASKDGKTWGEWTDIDAEGPLRDNDPHPDEMFPEAPIFLDGKFFQLSVQLERSDDAITGPEVTDLKVTYIDSRASQRGNIMSNVGSFLKPQVASASSEQGPAIVTRTGWGSPDPQGHNLKGTDFYWPPSHVPVRQIFLHHTVDSNNSSDFPAVVRAIWQYHTYTRGWGDIGYNYLVDGNGTIYEGRAGGSNVTGGHVFGFNRGSMGVGLIGCFQQNDPSCTSVNGGNYGPSNAMWNSLYNLLGWKTKEYEIDPRGSQTFCGNSDVGNQCLNIPTITGHRDGQQTSCPGNLVYDLLPTIRDATESRKANLFPYAAKQLTYGTINATSGQTSVTLSFKNTGSATWSNSSPRLFLKTANPDDRSSAFQGSGWITGQHAALLNQTSVPPGSVGTFTFNLDGSTKPDEVFYEGFRLVVEGVTDLKSYFTVPITGPTYRWNMESATYSSGTASMIAGGTQNITVTAKNTGSATWYQAGANPLRLATWLPDRASAFHNAGWLSSTRLAGLQETSVVPGGNGTFSFPVTAPSTPGEYGENVNLVAENRTWAQYNNAQLYFHVKRAYEWQVVSLSHSKGTALMEPGETQTITVVAKNTGASTWTKSGATPVRLGTWPPTRGSSTYSPSWFSSTRPAELQETTVAPGGTGTFAFTVRAPHGGEFFERINLVAEGQTWFNDPGLLYYLNVRQNYNWQVVSLNHSTGTAALPAGSQVTLTLKARNTGDVTWHKTGDFPIRLGTVSPHNRGSVFYRPSWIRDFRPVGLSENTIAPGEVGTFVFEGQVPATPGEYRERFSLVAENLKWFNDPGMYFYIKSY